MESDRLKEYADNADERLEHWVRKRMDVVVEAIEEDRTKFNEHGEVVSQAIIDFQNRFQEQTRRNDHTESESKKLRTALDAAHDRIAELEHTIAGLVEKVTFLVASKEASNELDEVEF